MDFQSILDALRDMATDPSGLRAGVNLLAGVLGLSVGAVLLWAVVSLCKGTLAACRGARSLFTPSALGRSILDALSRPDRRAGEKAISAGPVAAGDNGAGGWNVFVNGAPANPYLTARDYARIARRCERICAEVRRGNEADRKARLAAEARQMAAQARAVEPVASCTCNGCVALKGAKKELRGGLDTNHSAKF